MKNTTAAPKIKPLFGNVLIKPLEAENKTAGGIYLPDNAKEKPTIGEIMAIGDGDVTPKGDKHPMVVKVGQKVMYKKWGGNEVKVGHEEWTIVDQKDILAVME
ncbi:MAG: co-chaperone GroES [Candidatus Levybacteria bacterium]|nr:co-chaperone GroES [Candidatus Levybacteria bacterium]